MLVLGIGGSALGTKALVNALRPPGWNELDDEAREYFPRITVLENVDPTSVAAALRRIDPRRVLVNVISKSGGTAETLAQYLVVRAWLDRRRRSGRRGAPPRRSPPIPTQGRAAGDRRARRHRRARGSARRRRPLQRADRRSACFPAALVGIDIAGLLARRPARAGARAEYATCCENPPRSAAALLLGRRRLPGRPDPRADALLRPAARVRRLVRPALGREPGQAGGPARRGGPCRADAGRRGRRDRPAQPGAALHGRSVRQGGDLRPGRAPGEDVTIPRPRRACPKSWPTSRATRSASCSTAEQEATSAALARMGRMNVTISIPDRRCRDAGASC